MTAVPVDLIDTAEAARRIGCSAASVRTAVWRGKIKPELRGHAALWFSPEEVERYARDRYKNYKPRKPKT